MSASAAYHRTEGKAEVHDAATGTKVDHVAVMQAWVDPSQPLRDRIASRVAAHVQDRVSPTCVDVGCAIGNDCATLLVALGRVGQNSATVTGVDVMEAQLATARERVPEATFVQGDAARLPFEDASVDSLQCARLLIHSADLHATLDEFMRVLKPGGIGCFYEGDFRTQTLLTSDAAIAKVHAAKLALSTGGIANPNVAHAVFQYLLASPDAEQVTLDGFPSVQRDPTYGLGTRMLEMDKGQCRKLVEAGTLTQLEVDAYYAKLDAAVASGDWVETGLLFEIGFVKRI